ncbi:MAG: hypothetical protein HGA22_14160 [Clostridiales bacterium]|nr:hypothetical protein [Clostridiales bacterium]
MPAIDFEKEFAEFVGGGNGNAIRDIYDIIPTLNNGQIRIINTLQYYADKYDLDILSRQVENFLRYAKGNKNLSFLSSMNMRNLLKAHTQEELVKGIKIQSSNQKGDTV